MTCARPALANVGALMHPLVRPAFALLGEPLAGLMLAGLIDEARAAALGG